jgi:hypothetical protein
MKAPWTAAALLILIAAGHGVGICATSGLVTIPTADTVGAREHAFGLQFSEVNLPSGDIFDDYLETEFGLGDRCEWGVDQSLNAAGAWWNFKYVLCSETKSRPAMAIGVQNIGPGNDTQPFAVGYTSFGSTRLHAGAITVTQTIRGMVGIDYTASDRLLLIVDHMGGSDSFTGAAVQWSLGKEWSVTAAWLHGNASSTGNGMQYSLDWCSCRF